MTALTFDGPSVTLRPSGAGRYVGAVFLTVWLAGWVVGEVLAIGFLGLIVRSSLAAAAGRPWAVPGGDWIAGGAAGVALLFLLVWLAIWTVGGVAAIHELLRSLAGADRVSVPAGGRLELVWRAGPIRRRRTFDRAAIRQVRLRRHDGALVLHTASGSEVITSYGTPEERQQVASWVRQRLSLPEDGRRVDPLAAPPGWTMSTEGGTARIGRVDARSRRVAASLAWAVAGLVAFVASVPSGTEGRAGSLVALVLVGLLVATAAWVTWGRREWLVRHGEIVSHRRFLVWSRERSFRGARLEVVETTDSDGDHRCTLTVTDAGGSGRITAVLNDDVAVADLARWLAARTGFPLRLPPGASR